MRAMRWTVMLAALSAASCFGVSGAFAHEGHPMQLSQAGTGTGSGSSGSAASAGAGTTGSRSDTRSSGTAAGAINHGGSGTGTGTSDDPRSAALIEGAGLRRVVTGYSSAWLDLRQDREALLAGLHGKWRAALRRAEREDLTVAEDARQRQWQAALMLYESFRRKKRFVGLSADFIAALAAADRTAALSLTARRGGTPVAGVILLRHGASATYTASWTSDEGRAGQAHNLLLWRAVETLKVGGAQWLDLGGLNTESQPGLARFKLGLGGEVFTLTGSYL